jgi:thiol-disulfide isomerase/thioredoxin
MKKRNLRISILSLLAVCFASALFGQSSTIKLKIGDPAPELKVTWIKGTPVKDFNKDRLYVVEFWATWCGPCKLAMPHLSELAKQYTDKVTFIGVNIWEKGADKKLYETFLPSVKEFVTSMGDKMAYNVAMDNNDQHMGNNWMKAAGQYGIPSTFLIKEGKIIWIGHPMALDTTLVKVIGGTYNMENYTKQSDKSAEKMASYIALNKIVTDAIAAKDYSKALAEIENARTTIDTAFMTALDNMKFSTLLEYDVPQAIAFAREWSKSVPDCKAIVGVAIIEKDGLTKEAYQFALGFLSETMTMPGVPVAFIHHYNAIGYFKMNDITNAIASEEKAIEMGNKAIAAGEFEGTITENIVKEWQVALAKYKAVQK